MTANGSRQQGGNAFPGAARPQQERTPLHPGSRPVVFMLPGLYGEKDPELEKFLGPTRAHLDLAPVNYFDWAEHVETEFEFSALAAFVLRQIESRMPEGPVRMAGYSLGGHLAYSTALALEAKGRRVEALAILDAPVDFSVLKGSFRKRLRTRMEQFLRFNVRGGLASTISKSLIAKPSRPLLRRLTRYRQAHLPFRFEQDLHIKLTMQLARQIYGAWWHRTLSEAAPLRAPFYLFRSQEHGPEEEAGLGWARYCPNLRLIQVAGTHRGMLNPAINGPFRAAFVEALTFVGEPSGRERLESPESPAASCRPSPGFPHSFCVVIALHFPKPRRVVWIPVTPPPHSESE